MKLFTRLLIFTFLIALVFNAQANGDKPSAAGINWLTIEEAQEMGKKQPRSVFVDVYTDWCGWCKKMDKSTFQNAEVIKYVNDNYYAVKLNAESNETVTFNGVQLTKRELARAFRVTGYPTFVLIDETFQQITPVPGYKQAAEFKNVLKQFDQ